MQIVSFIIDTKVAEEEESANSLIKKQELEKLLAEKAKRQEAKVGTISDEELDAKIASLE